MYNFIRGEQIMDKLLKTLKENKKKALIFGGIALLTIILLIILIVILITIFKRYDYQEIEKTERRINRYSCPVTT